MVAPPSFLWYILCNRQKSTSQAFMFYDLLAYLQAFVYSPICELTVALSYFIWQPLCGSSGITYFTLAALPLDVHLENDWRSNNMRVPAKHAQSTQGLHSMRKYILYISFVTDLLFIKQKRKMHSLGFNSSVCWMLWHDHQSWGDSLLTDAENILKDVRIIEMFRKERNGWTKPTFPFFTCVISGVVLLNVHTAEGVVITFTVSNISFGIHSQGVKQQHIVFFVFVSSDSVIIY